MTCNSAPTVGSLRRAKKLNLEFDQGADFRLPITYRIDGVAVDLTGAIIRAQFREKVNSVIVLMEAGTADNTITTVPLEGRIILTMDHAITEALRIYRGVWDMLVVMPGEEQFKLLTGEWKIRRGVTR